MSRITLSHPEACEKLTARLFWKVTSATGYVDAGNVREYADATTRSLVTRARSAQGARHVSAEQLDINHESFTFLLDERGPEQEELIRLARSLSDQEQSSTEEATATIQSVAQGRWFEIGAYNIANIQVSGSLAGVLEEGSDYEIDLNNGRIKVIDGGSVATGETLYLTFDQPGISLEKRESQYTPIFYCDIILEEYNQFSKMWLRRYAFRGYVNVTEFPNHSGEFATYRVKITPAGPITILKRPTAESLTTLTETAEQPGQSSSSSSSNSSSSSSLSSSSSSSSTAISESSSSTFAELTSTSSEEFSDGAGNSFSSQSA